MGEGVTVVLLQREWESVPYLTYHVSREGLCVRRSEYKRMLNQGRLFQALADAEAAQDAAAAAEAKRAIEEERIKRAALAAEEEARKRAVTEAERKREERAKVVPLPMVGAIRGAFLAGWKG